MQSSISRTEFRKIKADIFKPVQISYAQAINKLVDTPAKIEPFITLKAVHALKVLYPELEITDYSYHKIPAQLKSYGIHIASIYTRPESNHPFVIYALDTDKYIYIIKPFGKGRGQVSINDYSVFTDPRFQDEMTIIEYYALFVLFAESVKVRRAELIDSRDYSLFKCTNIKQCKLKYKAIERQPWTIDKKLAELQHWKLYYEKKAITLLSKYFTLLESKDYFEAHLFLKGKHSKYFGKQRLDTFFVDTAGIIGHLEIFISIYEIMYGLIDRFKAGL